MIYILIAAAVAITEYFIKNHMEAHYKAGDKKEILKGRIVLNKYYNEGAFLNFMENKKEIVKTISGIILGLILLLFAFILPRKGNKLFKLGLSFALGGAISNVSDRFYRGHVVDYFSINAKKSKKLKYIVFNLADMAIFLGGLFLLLSSVLSSIFESGADKTTE